MRSCHAGNMRGFGMGGQQFRQFFTAGARSSLLGPVPMGMALKSPIMGFPSARPFHPHARYYNNNNNNIATTTASSSSSTSTTVIITAPLYWLQYNDCVGFQSSYHTNLWLKDHGFPLCLTQEQLNSGRTFIILKEYIIQIQQCGSFMCL